MIEEKKPFWKSKTFWFNALALTNTFAPMVGLPNIPMESDTTAAILTTGNILLRIVTKNKIGLTGNQQ